MRFFYFTYSALLCIFSPFICARLFWKARLLPTYKKRIKERFFINKSSSKPFDFLIHAVSMGEVVAVTPLVEKLLKKGYSVFMTTMTPSGSTQVQLHFKNRIGHQYLPYDIGFIMKCFLKHIDPKMILVMETELWPNFIHVSHQLQIPLFIINARISNRAYGRYQYMKFFLKPILRQIKGILAQSELDAERFIHLGTLPNQVKVLGNLKFDAQVMNKPCVQTGLENLSRTIFILASTHEGEETLWLEKISFLKATIPDLLMLIAPRHPERFQTVFHLCQTYDDKTVLRSKQKPIEAHTLLFVIDTLGELAHFYQHAHYAFLGGSLVPVGGHNVLEPISLGVPVFCGPHMENSKTIVESLRQQEAIQIDTTVEGLIKQLIKLHINPALKELQIQCANKVLKKNQGSLQRYLAEIEKRFPEVVQGSMDSADKTAERRLAEVPEHFNKD